MARKHHELPNQGITNEWYTPEALVRALGKFNLDPCFPVKPLYRTAKHVFTIKDDGLKQKWSGRVWLNPPYGKNIVPFMEKMAKHNNGIALVFARTDTRWFHNSVWNHAAGILFMLGRVHFLSPDGRKGSATAPTVLIAYGEKNLQCLKTCGIAGKVVTL